MRRTLAEGGLLRQSELPDAISNNNRRSKQKHHHHSRRQDSNGDNMDDFQQSEGSGRDRDSDRDDERNRQLRTLKTVKMLENEIAQRELQREVNSQLNNRITAVNSASATATTTAIMATKAAAAAVGAIKNMSPPSSPMMPILNVPSLSLAPKTVTPASNLIAGNLEQSDAETSGNIEQLQQAGPSTPSTLSSSCIGGYLARGTILDQNFAGGTGITRTKKFDPNHPHQHSQHQNQHPQSNPHNILFAKKLLPSTTAMTTATATTANAAAAATNANEPMDLSIEDRVVVLKALMETRKKALQAHDKLCDDERTGLAGDAGRTAMLEKLAERKRLGFGLGGASSSTVASGNGTYGLRVSTSSGGIKSSNNSTTRRRNSVSYQRSTRENHGNGDGDSSLSDADHENYAVGDSDDDSDDDDNNEWNSRKLVGGKSEEENDDQLKKVRRPSVDRNTIHSPTILHSLEQTPRRKSSSSLQPSGGTSVRDHKGITGVTTGISGGTGTGTGTGTATGIAGYSSLLMGTTKTGAHGGVDRVPVRRDDDSEQSISVHDHVLERELQQEGKKKNRNKEAKHHRGRGKKDGGNGGKATEEKYQKPMKIKQNGLNMTPTYLQQRAELFETFCSLPSKDMVEHAVLQKLAQSAPQQQQQSLYNIPSSTTTNTTNNNNSNSNNIRINSPPIQLFSLSEYDHGKPDTVSKRQQQTQQLKERRRSLAAPSFSAVQISSTKSRKPSTSFTGAGAGTGGGTGASFGLGSRLGFVTSKRKSTLADTLLQTSVNAAVTNIREQKSAANNGGYPHQISAHSAVQISHGVSHNMPQPTTTQSGTSTGIINGTTTATSTVTAADKLAMKLEVLGDMLERAHGTRVN
jgi:hypothetical protein